MKMTRFLVIATLLVSLFALTSSISLHASLTQLQTDINARLDAVNDRLVALEGRLPEKNATPELQENLNITEPQKNVTRLDPTKCEYLGETFPGSGVAVLKCPALGPLAKLPNDEFSSPHFNEPNLKAIRTPVSQHAESHLASLTKPYSGPLHIEVTVLDKNLNAKVATFSTGYSFYVLHGWTTLHKGQSKYQIEEYNAPLTNFGLNFNIAPTDQGQFTIGVYGKLDLNDTLRFNRNVVGILDDGSGGVLIRVLLTEDNFSVSNPAIVPNLRIIILVGSTLDWENTE